MSLSWFDRLLSRTRISWTGMTAIITGILLCVLLAAESLDGVFRRPFDLHFWQANLLGPMMVAYILITQPWFRRFRQEAIEAIRSLSTTNTEDFNRMVKASERGLQWRESAAFVVGALIGIGALRPWVLREPFVWTREYRVVATGLMCGLGAGVVASTLVGAHLLSRLHRQPLHIDIWDTSGLEPIVRRGLFLALVLVGGVTLGLLFIPSQSTAGVVIDAVVLVVAVVIFVLSIWDTHVVMLRVKQREIQSVRAHLAAVYQDIGARHLVAGDSDLSALATVTNLWLTYEKRIKEAPEWPFTNSTVVRLAVSTLIPIGIVVIQHIVVDRVVGRAK